MAFPVIDSLILWMMDSGVEFRVTSTWRPSDTRSFHSQGRAVDFAGKVPGMGTPALRAIYDALLPLAPECTELIYYDQGWLNGKPHRYRLDVQRAHRDHVHIAMPADWRYQTPEEPVAHPQSHIVSAFPFEDGYVLVASDGAVYCFNCTYHGGLKWDETVHGWVPR